MGNRVSSAVGCLIPNRCSKHGDSAAAALGIHYCDPPPDEGLGHSFYYVRPATFGSDSSSSGSETSRPKSMSETSFKVISGASVSANTATPRSMTSQEQFNSFSNILFDRASAFESTSSFNALPLQPVPRGSIPNSGPLSGPLSTGVPTSGTSLERGFLSGPLERGFMSGPMERGVLSGPLEAAYAGHFSAPLAELYQPSKLRRRTAALVKHMRTLSRPLQKALMRKMANALEKTHQSLFAPMKLFVMREGSKEDDRDRDCVMKHAIDLAPDMMVGNYDASSDPDTKEQANLQWAQGKAGEDRVHVVLSEEHGWLFVGIYDGFNGPDAPDFLMSNLYPAIYQELKGLLWDQDDIGFDSFCPGGSPEEKEASGAQRLQAEKKLTQEKLQLKQQEAQDNERSSVDHSAVLEALERALKATEAAFLEMADRVLHENPELMVMGSCVLVMLMKDEDVYIMNVGDSRAVVAQQHSKRWGSLSHVGHAQPNGLTVEEPPEKSTGVRDTLLRLELDKIIEEAPTESKGLKLENGSRSLASDPAPGSLLLDALQLSSDHSTSILEEVLRIKAEHPNDENAISNNRVKGQLKVTRAFGAGFLKQPVWNNALLKMFRCDFEGTDPYITCNPFLHHHRLGPQDHFLVLSSDGLYQYLSNEEVVSRVQWFMQNFPDGDPAQHLIEELLFRAAKKNGMDFHELLDIPQGDRRKYHDDVYVMVISLEGRIWKSAG
ncbi:unnamed protein product [Sphagnum troendelagicum]|uniref:PPM-type phosphatase domain-containing protein n=1 Tax=Sphagnum troendelagicum TaxID=128251 RepID=A0ABP0TP93_9BRYO